MVSLSARTTSQTPTTWFSKAATTTSLTCLPTPASEQAASNPKDRTPQVVIDPRASPMVATGLRSTPTNLLLRLTDRTPNPSTVDSNTDSNSLALRPTAMAVEARTTVAHGDQLR